MFIISIFRYYHIFSCAIHLIQRYIFYRIYGITKIMLVPLNGPNVMALSIPLQSNATSAGRSGQLVTTTAYQILLSKVNLMRKARSQALAATCRPQKPQALTHRDIQTETFGVRRMNPTTGQNQIRLPVDGDTLLILKMQRYPAPRKEEKRRKKTRRIGGKEQRMRILFLRNKVNDEDQRGRRGAGLRHPVKAREIPEQNFLRIQKVVCMVRGIRLQKDWTKEQQTMCLSTSFRMYNPNCKPKCTFEARASRATLCSHCFVRNFRSSLIPCMIKV